MKGIATKTEFKNYSMCLRDAVAIFTKELINCLFDVQYEEEKGALTKGKFLIILERLSVENKACFWLDFDLILILDFPSFAFCLFVCLFFGGKKKKEKKEEKKCTIFLPFLTQNESSSLIKA